MLKYKIVGGDKYLNLSDVGYSLIFSEIKNISEVRLYLDSNLMGAEFSVCVEKDLSYTIVLQSHNNCVIYGPDIFGIEVHIQNARRGSHFKLHSGFYRWYITEASDEIQFKNPKTAA